MVDSFPPHDEAFDLPIDLPIDGVPPPLDGGDEAFVSPIDQPIDGVPPPLDGGPVHRVCEDIDDSIRRVEDLTDRTLGAICDCVGGLQESLIAAIDRMADTISDSIQVWISPVADMLDRTLAAIHESLRDILTSLERRLSIIEAELSVVLDGTLFRDILQGITLNVDCGDRLVADNEPPGQGNGQTSCPSGQELKCVDTPSENPPLNGGSTQPVPCPDFSALDVTALATAIATAIVQAQGDVQTQVVQCPECKCVFGSEEKIVNDEEEPSAADVAFFEDDPTSVEDLPTYLFYRKDSEWKSDLEKWYGRPLEEASNATSAMEYMKSVAAFEDVQWNENKGSEEP